MKVLVADAFESSGIDGLKACGCEVLYEPTLKDAALAEAIRSSDAQVLVVRSTQVTAPMLDAGKLALIVRAGAGVNTIDVAAASSRGIYVSNCPAKNAAAVAELVFALLLAIDRRVPDNVAELRAGNWNKKEFSKARGLVRPDARPAWIRQHRAGSCAASARVRHAGDGLEPKVLTRHGGGTTGRRSL